jgi:hypothetical protein
MQLGGTNITIQPLTQKTGSDKEIEVGFFGDILEEFDSSFSSKTPVEKPHDMVSENIALYNTEQQVRLKKIIERISRLDDSKPEYLEELIALETKKIEIEQEIEAQKNAEVKNRKTLATEKQKQTVADLLAKKAFSYKASFLSPEEEEQKRLKFAQKAASTEIFTQQRTQQQKETTEGPKRKIPVLTHEDTAKINEIIDAEMAHSQKARLLREEMINHLRKTSRVSWFENPQENREWINDHIVKTAAILGKKSGGDVDMHDIQTARLFLFQNTPQDIKDHPAYKYVESFYDFQYDQGHSGDIEKSKKIAPSEPTKEIVPEPELSNEVKKELSGEKPEIEDAWDANLFS